MTKTKVPAWTARDPAAAAFEALADLQAVRPEGMARISLVWFEGAGKLGAEATRFIAGRIAENLAAQHAMLRCKSPADLMQVQRDFLQRALDQYAAEGGKLMRMGNDIMERALVRERR